MPSGISNPFQSLRGHWPNHADPVCIPFPTTCLGLKLSAYWRRVSLLYPSPFHKLIPRFWIHQAWWPFTP
jgi:hypothetical protein